MDSVRSSYVRKVRRKGGRIKWGLSYIGADGRRRQEIAMAATRRAAEQLLAQKLKEVDRQRETGIQPVTYEEFCEKYLPHQKAVVEPKTYERCEQVVRDTKPFIGNRLLADIHARDIQEYVDRRLQGVRKLKKAGDRLRHPGTVARELIVLSGIFSRAVDWDYLVKNPAKKVKIRKYESRKQRVLALDEEAILLWALDRPQRRYLAGIVILALETGLRRNEILRLTWSAISLVLRSIQLVSTYRNPNKGKRTRVIVLTEQAHQVLAKLYMEALRAVNGDRDALSSRYVFINPETGTRYTNLKWAWTAARREAKLLDVRFHDLRHSFATRALNNGATLAEVQQVLGHREITTTMRYVYLDARNFRNVAKAIEGFRKKEADDASAGEKGTG